jgi:hypothetical protein
MKNLLLLSVAALLTLPGAAQTTTLINPTGDGGFETGTTFAGNNWVLATAGGPANDWFVGNGAPAFAGARCAYISDANNGSQYQYNVTNATVCHFYRDVTIPAGQNYLTLSFQWKNYGETGYDDLRVFLVPTTTTPVAGTQLFAGQVGGPYSASNVWNAVTLSLPCNLAGTTQRLVFSWRNDGIIGTQPPASVDNISLVSTSIGPSCNTLLGTGVTTVAALPYASGAGTTCGAGNDITSTNVPICGSSWYYNGEDQVWVFTPTASGNITITLTSSGSYTGLMLYQGCPVGCSAAPVCVAQAQDWTGSKSMCVPVTSGITYYLILDSWPSPMCNAYSNLTISAPSGIPAGTVCSNAAAIGLPFSATGQTTACYGNDYTNASTGSCGSLYESGEDRVYALTVASAQCIGISLTNCSSSSIGYQVYSGCPGSAGAVCIGSNGGANPLSGNVVLPAPGTYYIIVDSWANPFNVNYDISVTSFGSGPVNDLACGAINIPINSTISGDNSCSGGTGEPAPPACWWNGTLNTVWFSVICPASGQLTVQTAPGSLTDTQIQLWSGTCGSLTAVAGGCNDNATVCSGWVYYSQITVTGLTPGATYWISVDGYNNSTGTFSITASDASTVVYTTQDCAGAVAVCNSVISQPQSFFGCGAVNDIPASGSFGNPSVNPASTNSGCMFSGELHTVWYTITIASSGNLAWTVSPAVTGFYDWNLYPATTNTCADIANNTVAPVRCNWNCTSLSPTGMQTVANQPAGSSPCNFEPPLAVTAGETYKLCLSNYSGTSGGFTLDFSNSTAGISTPTSLTWTGSTSTAWNLNSNWGMCTPPTCGIDAYVISSTNQPVISTNQSVRNLTIAVGATLTINPGVTLTICGDLNVYGTLIASPTSTILFNNGSVIQTINGTLTGASAVGNLTITKTGGSVVLNSNIDIAGTFTTSNATSVFNTTGKYVRVGGNFVNAAGNTTFSNTGTTGTLQFYGSAAQTYNQGSAQLDLNFVVMNHTGAGVTLQTNMFIKATTGSLTLTAGKIITGANEVRVLNTTASCVSAGNNTSYVEGFLRRWLTTGSYDFPVGEAVKGYQRANVNVLTNANVSNLRANFVQYAATPGPLGTIDCGANYNMPALDNGKWIINAYDAALTQITGTCTYDMTLYNRVGSYSNSAGSMAWTVMKDPNGSGAWALNGTCSVSSVLNATKRDGMSGFSHFGTALSTTPLPVELISFEGEQLDGQNHLFWATASEMNNDYFTLERSADGITFYEIDRQDGAGTTSQMHSYESFDNYPLEGINYYRLKQTDFNGTFTYSGIVALQNHVAGVQVVNVHPVPTIDVISFDITSPEQAGITIDILDLSGRKVMSTSAEIAPGESSVGIDITGLSQGVYMLQVTMPCCNFVSVNRIVRD